MRAEQPHICPGMACRAEEVLTGAQAGQHGQLLRVERLAQLQDVGVCRGRKI